jgi:hypothetical protein
MTNDEGKHRSTSCCPRLALVAFLLLPAANEARDVATVAVIPDTQNYVDATKPQPASLETFKGGRAAGEFSTGARRVFPSVFTGVRLVIDRGSMGDLPKSGG